MRRIWAGMVGWFGRESEVRRGADRHCKAMRPTVEPCEGRLLLSRAVAPAQALGHRVGREIQFGAELNGIAFPTVLSPTVFQSANSGTGRGTAPLRQFTFETSDVTTFTSPETADVQGSFTLTTPKGSRITGTYTGNDYLIPSQQTLLDEFRVTVTGGTGRFRGATGSLIGRDLTNIGPATPTLPANGINILLFGTLTLRRARS